MVDMSKITDWRDGVERACDNFNPDHHKKYKIIEFIDIDGMTVSVGLSSSAMRECCRIWVDDPEHPEETAHLHLCRCMAAELRAALDRAFEGTLDKQPRCPEKEKDL